MAEKCKVDWKASFDKLARWVAEDFGDCPSSYVDDELLDNPHFNCKDCRHKWADEKLRLMCWREVFMEVEEK